MSYPATPATPMRKVLILNPKGGSGKTTLATNLAAYYASTGMQAALLDMDAQGSSLRWLSKRNGSGPQIHGLQGFDIPSTVTRTFALRPPADTQRLVVDTPAGLAKQELVLVTRDADRILIPVLPSDIDIHAATRCVRDLLITARIPRAENRIAVVANRVKRNTLIFRSLLRFLETLHIPAVAVLRDSQNYVRAFEAGQGIHEMKGAALEPDIDNWRSLIDWVEHGTLPASGSLWDGAEDGIGTNADAATNEADA